MGIDEGAPKRFWAKHKVQAVLRLLRGEDIDLVSRDIRVTAATLTHGAVDKDVIHPSASAVHGDGDAGIFERLREILASELRSSVRVEDFRHPIVTCPGLFGPSET